MRLKKGGAASAGPVTFELGHGVVMTARVLDAYGHKLALAEAHADMNAIVAGEPTERDWVSFDSARREVLRTSETARVAALGWMHAVLLATACATALDGVVDDETGEPLEPSFETFELLFNDAGVEFIFRAQAFKVEQVWSAEKNVLGPGSIGSGPEGSITAAPAKQPETPAPAAESEATESDARSSPQPPEPPKASSPGELAQPAAAGPSQA